ncbi:biopolymer transporter ExbD [Vibrio sp. JPW-9-11-11]|uniref:ExbD/TolR family protein n=1 Tax=Vibrio sp. JPW-9-11-11 TaxID=1416532 RepID=UPI001594262B|nr:biopolymer transporter ExbD [Vibrio sp. JPW-9-11-11]NVD06735.1 biopolymer transporter ExbD [Vibrio sp. JPW-9-11-11]
MRLGRRVEQQEEAHIDLTPMLDIVFIMLIFFIVTSAFVSQSGVEVNQPKASQASQQKQASIFIAVTGDNEIYVDKRLVDIEALESALNVLRAERPKVGLMIQADEFAFNGTVVRVMNAAKSAGIEQIALGAERR